ncbi:MAG: DNA glycosylase AlkZ-like family protein, partial [Burkholderiales bacterium]
MPLTVDQLRRYALARSLFKPTSLGRAIARLGFVQADPLRAPARAQDLTLRHRVPDYRAGDLERRYPKLPIEE